MFTPITVTVVTFTVVDTKIAKGLDFCNLIQTFDQF